MFYRGRWYEGLYMRAGASEDDLRQLEAFEKEVAHLVAWREGEAAALFAIPVATGTDDSEITSLDKITMAEWLTARDSVAPLALVR